MQTVTTETCRSGATTIFDHAEDEALKFDCLGRHTVMLATPFEIKMPPLQYQRPC